MHHLDNVNWKFRIYFSICLEKSDVWVLIVQDLRGVWERKRMIGSILGTVTYQHDMFGQELVNIGQSKWMTYRYCTFLFASLFQLQHCMNINCLDYKIKLKLNNFFSFDWCCKRFAVPRIAQMNRVQPITMTLKGNRSGCLHQLVTQSQLP